MDETADVQAARRMFERCSSGRHDEGELDERIVVFYEELRSYYPDQPPSEPDSPWMSIPLAVGIDHVIMHLSFLPKSSAAIEKIQEFAAKHRLTIYDPQSDDAYVPISDDSRREPDSAMNG